MQYDLKTIVFISDKSKINELLHLSQTEEQECLT